MDWNDRLRRLTPLRFIAALLVVLFHFAPGVPPFTANSTLLTVIWQGNLAVSFFFCLSGLVMGFVHRPADGKLAGGRYWRSRMARLYPLYFLAIAMTLVHWPAPLDEIILNLLMLQSWVPGDALSINPPGWSLSVEAFFYAIFPLLARCLTPERLNRTAAVTLVLWLATQIAVAYLRFYRFDPYPSPAYDLIFYFPLMHLNEFIIGAVAARLFLAWQPGRRQRSRQILALLGAALLLDFALHHLFLAMGLYPIPDDGLLAPVFSLSFLLIMSIESRAADVLKNKFLVFAGNISYAIYILQAPVHGWFIYLIWENKINVDSSVALMFYISFLIIFSSAAYLFIESPCREVIKHLGVRRASRSERS